MNIHHESHLQAPSGLKADDCAIIELAVPPGGQGFKGFQPKSGLSGNNPPGDPFPSILLSPVPTLLQSAQPHIMQ